MIYNHEEQGVLRFYQIMICTIITPPGIQYYKYTDIDLLESCPRDGGEEPALRGADGFQVETRSQAPEEEFFCCPAGGMFSLIVGGLMFLAQ